MRGATSNVLMRPSEFKNPSMRPSEFKNPAMGDFNDPVVSIHTVTRGNNSALVTSSENHQSKVLNAQDSFGSPNDKEDHEIDLKLSVDDLQSSVQSSSKFFHPVQVSDKASYAADKRYEIAELAEKTSNKGSSSKKDDSFMRDELD